MEVNKKYRVVYWDGEKIADRILIFLSEESDFLEFLNPNKKVREFISKKNIVRIEEVVE